MDDRPSVEHAFEELGEFAPDLASYDVIVVNSSAGKDSQAMLDEVVRLVDEQGVSRDRIKVAHADLGRIEWDGVRALAQEQAEHYGLAFEAISRPGGDLLHQIRLRAEKRPDVAPWPDSGNRYCTSDQKRDQVSKLITKWVNEAWVAKGKPTRRVWREGRKDPSKGRYVTVRVSVRVLNCLGIRAQESTARAKKNPFQRDRRLSNTRREVDAWFPIFDWTEEQVWARIRESGVRHHRAYDLGMPRLSCLLCVFAPEAALVIAGRENPDLLREYRQVEIDTGYTFRSGFSLERVVARVEAGDACQVSAEEATSWVM